MYPRLHCFFSYTATYLSVPISISSLGMYQLAPMNLFSTPVGSRGCIHLDRVELGKIISWEPFDLHPVLSFFSRYFSTVLLFLDSEIVNSSIRLLCVSSLSSFHVFFFLSVLLLLFSLSSISPSELLILLTWFTTQKRPQTTLQHTAWFLYWSERFLLPNPSPNCSFV